MEKVGALPIHAVENGRQSGRDRSLDFSAPNTDPIYRDLAADHLPVVSKELCHNPD